MGSNKRSGYLELQAEFRVSSDCKINKGQNEGHRFSWKLNSYEKHIVEATLSRTLSPPN